MCAHCANLVFIFGSLLIMDIDSNKSPNILKYQPGYLADFVGDLRTWVFKYKTEAARYVSLHHSTIGRYEKPDADGIRPPIGYLAVLAKLLFIQGENDGIVSEELRSSLLEEVNRAIQFEYFLEEVPFKDWDELVEIADSYIEGRRGTIIPASFDESESIQFPPEHLTYKMEPIRQAIKALHSIHPKINNAYFYHVDQVIKYLSHFVGLLPPDHRLNEQEIFTLLAAAYLYNIGRHFPQPEHSNVLKSRLMAIKERGAVQVSRLVGDYYHELSWEWIQDSVADGRYPSLGLKPDDDPVKEIALVCMGHRDTNLSGDRYKASGKDSHRIRPALLAALLSVADMLASLTDKPNSDDLLRSKESPETQVSAWLRYYLERVSIEHGHIRFHYLLPDDDDSTSIHKSLVVLSAPVRLRLRSVVRILDKNNLTIYLDSSVDNGPGPKMPPNVLDCAMTLARQWVDSLSTAGALGQPSDVRALFQFTGLRKQPTLKWLRVEGAEHYLLQLFDMKQNFQGKWKTTASKISLPGDQIEPGIQYEWITYAYKGRRQLQDCGGGVFWILDQQTVHWIDRQIAWYDKLPQLERQLMLGRILTKYRLYLEAISIYQKIIENGSEIMQLQAIQELIELNREISRRLNRLKRPSKADEYLNAALALARELREMISRSY